MEHSFKKQHTGPKFKKPQAKKPWKPQNKNTQRPASQRDNTTSWEPVAKWYKDIVGTEGHYYHQRIILPGVMKIMDLKNTLDPAVLDIACGQGVLGANLPREVEYIGLDVSPDLIRAATRNDKSKTHSYHVHDVTKPLGISKKNFSHATIILALQNIEHAEKTVLHAAHHLRENGQLIIVLNHPAFRIPRQSMWQVDQDKKIQYRRIDRYASSMTIPILAHPSKGTQSAETLTFHRPISVYSKWLKDAGFLIETIDEWCSDKKSEGGAAKMENRARDEFPLFMTIVARKT
jgi:ubiquinone/menaquinone biosynthesis C-methylase UbiE